MVQVYQREIVRIFKVWFSDKNIAPIHGKIEPEGVKLCSQPCNFVHDRLLH